MFHRLRNLDPDITNKISEFAEAAKLITAADNMGYFGYNESLTTYVEIISLHITLNVPGFLGEHGN